MDPEISRQLDAVAELLARVEHVLFITGAGISADSGLPTYRGIGGLYDVDDTPAGLPIEEILSGPMFASDPELTWKYLAQIALAAAGANANPAHQVIAACERRLSRVWVLTQNVDGFHRQAGSQNVIEIHGNMQHLQCPACGDVSDADHELLRQLPFQPPCCKHCQVILRPRAILFGEPLPEPALERLYTELARGFELIFTIGTSSLFPYISGPVEQAIEAGIPTVEINPATTSLSHQVTHYLPLPAADALTHIWQRWPNQP